MTPNVKWIAFFLLMALHPLHDEFSWLIAQARTPVVRGIRQFAEAEYVIPKGHYRGTRFRSDTQPFLGLLLDAIDSGRWRRFATVGCVQSGKTIGSCILPIMLYLFEYKEAVIFGGPTMDLLEKRWGKEVLPAIKASRYADQLPTSGAASKGGFGAEMIFRNGASLTFMSGSGGDEKRSGDTARVVVLTEADKFDEAGETSRETDPVSQMEARTLSYPIAERRFYEECTVSVETGRIWTDYQAGTASRIACVCPHCGEYVTPEREHLLGWHDAETKEQAAAKAYFACPECAQAITPAERDAMNRSAKLVHRGQTIDADGVIHGDLPQTETLGFRWNAFNNLFWLPGELGAMEWEAIHAPNEDAQERKLTQFVWVKPYKPPDFDLTPLDAMEVRKRFADRRYGKGLVPDDTQHLVMGIDIGKRFCSWVLVAWRPDCRGHVVDYSTFEVPCDSMVLDRAILAALAEFRDDVVLAGWPTADGEMRIPELALVDAHYEPAAIYSFLRQPQTGRRFVASIGYGESQHDKMCRSYSQPKRGGNVKLLGEQYHVVWVAEERCFRIDMNADHWKTWLHKGLRVPQGEPGGIELYWSTDRNEHTSLAKQYAAEYPQETFVEGKGSTIRWIQKRRRNHQLDTSYMACVAGHICGVRLLPKPQAQPTNQAIDPRPALTMPDGRPYLVTERR
jgi:phage terminase large subunit GpA-like protein